MKATKLHLPRKRGSEHENWLLQTQTDADLLAAADLYDADAEAAQAARDAWLPWHF